MDYITNGMLKDFLIDYDEQLFEGIIQSPKFDAYDKEHLNFDIIDYMTYLKELRVRGIVNSLPLKEAQRLGRSLAYFSSFYRKRSTFKRIIESDLKECVRVQNSNLSHRDVILARQVEKQKTILECASKVDFVDFIICSLNKLCTINFPKDSKFDRAVKISEILNCLAIYKKEPYMTLEEADDYAARQGLKSGKKVIYDRLAKYII